SSTMPQVGGQYAYIREAYHPAVAFVYGWGLLLVTQTGGMAAVAVTFAKYFRELTRWNLSDAVVASAALGALTLINCFGVRAGSSVQSTLMVMKIVAIAMLIVCGLALLHPAGDQNAAALAATASAIPSSFGPITAVAAAMIPVLFAYGGWQTSCFIAGEIKEPRKNLPRGLIIGVLGVAALYLAVNFVCVRALGPDGLARTTTPASEIMRLALGRPGVVLIAIGIAISTLGFLSQSILTAPRVYYAMSEDGVFLKAVGWVHPRTRVPVVAIALQGIMAIIIALSGRYEQILNYVVSVDFIFFGFTATCIFVFRRRQKVGGGLTGDGDKIFRVPGHPVTTALFILVSFVVVVNTVYQFPRNTVIG
ncbi:MAG: APC family permease, partial [Blastocatellia bacterium]